ncbi:hypothetical protein EYF80_016374 [Liparis tanakae]|uniref:Uncharacterized protein n=1 Tax=Liparis tanakae TaxID=230148 RepID=A0A4Z2I6H3_9TELE|nr:hypothetical protein EYF80_016374 [Liparis tanakae]
MWHYEAGLIVPWPNATVTEQRDIAQRILLLGAAASINCPFSSGPWLGAGVSVWVSFWALSGGAAAFRDFCLLRVPSLPALISFSPTLSTRTRPTAPWHSFLEGGSLDLAPIEGGRANLEALDILRFGGSVKLLQSFSASRVTIPALRQTEIIDRERFLDSKRRKKREGDKESAGRGFAEEPFSSGAAAQAVPDVCAALHVFSRPLRATRDKHKGQMYTGLVVADKAGGFGKQSGGMAETELDHFGVSCAPTASPTR